MRNSKKIKIINDIANKNAKINNENFDLVSKKFDLLCKHLNIKFVTKKEIIESVVFGDHIHTHLEIEKIDEKIDKPSKVQK